MYIKLVLFGFLGLLGFAPRAHSSTLGSISASAGAITVQPSQEATLSALFAIGDPRNGCFVVEACTDVALLQGLSSSSSGTSIIIDSSSSNFAAVAAALIEGENLSLGIVPGPSYGTSSGGSAGFPFPDFSGDTISSIVLSIDNVVIRPSTGPGIPGLPVIPGTEFDLFFTLDVDGAPAPIPEPRTWLSLFAGLSLLVGLKRTYRTKFLKRFKGDCSA